MQAKTPRVIFFGLCFVSALSFLLLFYFDDGGDVGQAADADFVINADHQVLDAAPAVPPKIAQLALKESAKNIVPDDLENPFFEAETKARLIQVADTFAEDIQYPDYSKPIRHPSELGKYLPNQSIASSLPLEAKKEDSPRISIKASKLQYFKGEAITGTAMVEGLVGNESVEVSARLVSRGDVLTQTEAEPQDGRGQTFHIQFSAGDIPELGDSEGEAASDELRLIARFTINQKVYEIGTPVKYAQAVASIDYVADAQVNDTFLEIPVYLTTQQLGYHQISGNLYHAETGQALIHLSAEKELLVEKDFILFKAHIAALKATGHEGPYLLNDLTLTRMPSPPNFATEFGTVPDEGIHLRGYPFEDYRDEAYVDEEAQSRLEFLSKLGGQR
ncbi:MAG: hypothetical protein ACMZ64_06915 [Oleiphilus sp.]